MRSEQPVETKVQPEAPTASPAINEQSLTAFYHVEITRDLDDGRLTLTAAAEQNLGDLREVVPARAHSMLDTVLAKVNEMRRLINEFEAQDTLTAILAEHELTLVEVDMVEVAAFGEDLASRLSCWAGRENGRLIVWVPKGQDPLVRVNAVAALANDPDSVIREG